MLAQLLKSILLAVRSNSGYIHLLDEADDILEKKMLHLAVAQGLSVDQIDRLKTIALGQGLAGWVTGQDELLVVPNVADDPRTLELAPEKKQGYTGAPIRVSGKVLGTLSVLHTDKQSISAEEVALLASVADQIGIVVESARLRRQAEQAAVLAERERLARDLHDAVTQSLYSLTQFAETSLKLVESGQVDDQIDLVTQNLTRIRDVALQALREMRLLIHELKPLDLSRGLAEALHRRLHTVEERAKIKTKFVAADPIEIPRPIEEGLYWIAQEALNNALKHANATEVTVYLNGTDGQVELGIVDNGSGFDPNTVGTGGMGLANMRERAERLGGSLSINSNPAKGTQIKIAVSAT
jgi:signal transduction histidine kinase